MSDVRYTEDETVRLARENEAEAARIERYCDYVVTSLDYELFSVGADFREIVDSCREIDVMMAQLRRSAQPQVPTFGEPGESNQERDHGIARTQTETGTPTVEAQAEGIR